MGREEQDPYDARTTRSSLRGDTEPTDRLGTNRPAAPADPVNPDWRGSRGTRRNRRGQALPSSRQEFVLWLQYGGWRIVLAAALLVILSIGMIYFLRTPKSTPFNRPTEQASLDGAGGVNVPLLPTTTPLAIQPTAAPAPASSGGATFRVFNTGTEGLLLRPDHNTDQPPVKTLPEGSLVTIAGPDFSGPDRVWKHVRDAEGAEGWVAADYLQSTQ